MATTLARPPYAKRDVPYAYDRGWWQTELGNIQRAIPPDKVGTLTAGSYTPTAMDSVLLANASSGPITITLPAPERVKGLVLTIKRIDATGANAVTIVGTVDGTVNPTLNAQYKAIQIVAAESGWYELNEM